jgi:SAM-dependent methyltransferase
MKMSLPWQIRLFKKSLKKKEKVKTILSFLGPIEGKTCLEIGCEKGILSYYLRKKGGRWFHAEVDRNLARATHDLIDENVAVIQATALPFADRSFDLILAIDILEHLEDDQQLLRELARLLKPGGDLVVTVPHSLEGLVLNRWGPKWGLTLDYYGHRRAGYTEQELTEKLRAADFQPRRAAEFSRFFTEFLEMGINLAYAFGLQKGKKQAGIKGSIAPGSEQEFTAHHLSFGLYSLVHPFLWLTARMDKLFRFRHGYVLIVQARKAGAEAGSR